VIAALPIKTQLTSTVVPGPFIFMICELVTLGMDSTLSPVRAALSGTHVSSLYRLKDEREQDGAFFVFGDLSVHMEGSFKLRFNLFELTDGECIYVKSTESAPFSVGSARDWIGMAESTAITRKFVNQGVRLRLRRAV
jgi:hypothetical protein